MLLSAMLLFSAPAWAEDEPVTVTSDTRDYCVNLAARIDMEGGMPSYARTLWERGRTMCEHGNVKAGLNRLRRVMQLVHGEGGG